MRIDANLLATLAAVVREGGFDKAARALHLTQSAVSQRIRQLEELIGRPLVDRVTPARPTEAGSRVLRHAMQVELLEEALARDIDPDREGEVPRLPVAVNADSLATWFLPAVADLLRSGRMLLELAVDDQEMTHRLLSGDGAAACVATRPSPVQGCRVEPLGSMEYVCVASPDFAARHFSRGADAASLRRAPAVVFNRRDELHFRFVRRHFDLGAGDFPYHVLPSSQAFVDAALAGLACALVPRLQAAAELADGRLVDAFPGRSLTVALYWHTWSVRPPALEELSAAVVAHARRVLRQG